MRIRLIAAGICLIAFGIWKLVAVPPTAPAPVSDQILSEAERIAAFARADREKLQAGSGAKESEIVDALIRLSRTRDPLAREVALKRRSAPTALVRAGVAAALGSYDDADSLAALKSLVRDADPSVRLRAIEAAGSVRSSSREIFLRELLEKGGLAQAEKAAAVAARVNADVTGVARVGGVAELLHLIRSGVPDEIAARAVQDAINLAPRDAGVLKMLRELLVAGKVRAAHSSAIRQLAITRDAWLREHAAQLLESGDPAVRTAVLQSLHASCPAGLWPMLEGFFDRERERSVVLAAVSELNQLPGNEARELLDRLIAQKRLAGTELEQARATLSGLRAATSPNPCRE